jgi:hypothetical protein
MRLVGILFVLMMAKCGYAQTSADWKTLERSGYSIKYPANWKLDESGELESKFYLFAPLESENDDFMEHVYLIAYELKGSNLDDEYSRISGEEIAKRNSNLKMLESKKLSAANPPYRIVIFTGDQANFNLKFTQYCWFSAGKAYLLTFVAEQYSYEKFRPTAEAILKTFVLKR